MGKAFDYEALRKMFQDDREWASVGQVTVIEKGIDGSIVRAKVQILDGDINIREIVCRIAFDLVFSLPKVGDIVLVNIPDGEPEYATIQDCFPSKDEPVPADLSNTVDVMAARLLRELAIISQLKIYLAKSKATATEPAVLGTQHQLIQTAILSALSTLVTVLAAHTHTVTIASLGVPTPTPPPNEAAAITAVGTALATEAAKVAAGAMLSDLVFLEKKGP